MSKLLQIILVFSLLVTSNFNNLVSANNGSNNTDAKNSATDHSFNLTVNIANQAAQMPLVIISLGKLDERMSRLTDQISRDLELSGQFSVQVHEGHPEITSVGELKKLSQQQFPLAIFLNFSSADKSEVEWRLYDTVNAKMLAGKKVAYHNLKLKTVAHELSQQIWLELTGTVGCFKTVIAACKRFTKPNGKFGQHIYAMHVTDGPNSSATHHHKQIVVAPTANFAPRWHATKPILYYAQQTVRNVRLMSLDSAGRNKIIADFDGLNLTPTFAPDGSIALTLSWQGKERLCKYKYQNHKAQFESISGPDIDALSPKFIDNHRILFCAINHKNMPRIAIYDLHTGDLDYITDHKYAVSPDHCATTQKIIYCKKVDGIQQIFVCQLQQNGLVNNHKQLTFSKGDKDNCSWSPCGNYIVYSDELGNQSRLGLYNCLTSKTQYLTPANEHWSFPNWSPVYMEIPFI
ncbi:MAG TPA: hypothetical protein VJJ81_01130 [Candidatus Babeliales bacterium]|nr:hypothetical protein [Candidatus Babeliales bacterium]